jgi:hypothetical protein
MNLPLEVNQLILDFAIAKSDRVYYRGQLPLIQILTINPFNQILQICKMFNDIICNKYLYYLYAIPRSDLSEALYIWPSLRQDNIGFVVLNDGRPIFVYHKYEIDIICLVPVLLNRHNNIDFKDCSLILMLEKEFKN